MTDSALAEIVQPTPRKLQRIKAAIAAIGAGVLGAAPHVLHHVGPLAGAALLAGATGRLLFGLAGFVLAIPMLRRIRRHSQSWRPPMAMLAVMVAMFTFSSFVVGPALTDDGNETPVEKGADGATGATGATGAEHEVHHE